MVFHQESEIGAFWMHWPENLSSRILHSSFKREMDRIFVCIVDIFLLVLLIWIFAKLFDKNTDTNLKIELKWSFTWTSFQMTLVRQICGFLSKWIFKLYKSFVDKFLNIQILLNCILIAFSTKWICIICLILISYLINCISINISVKLHLSMLLFH